MRTVMLSFAAVFCLASGLAMAASPARFADRVEAKGDTRERLQRAYDRLSRPPLGDLAFVLSDVTFQLKRRFTEYSGDVSGRMLGALTACDLVLGSESRMIPMLVAGFTASQKPDGHFGAEQNLEQKVDQALDMPILWGNGRMMLALAEFYRKQPNPDVLAMAKRLGEYACMTRKYYGKKENFENVGGTYSSGFTTCYPSMIDGLAAIGDVAGDARFVDEAKFIARLSLLDKGFSKHHSHGRLTAYRGMLDLDRMTGTREFLPEVEAGWQTIVQDCILPTGGITEVFDRTYVRDEGCTEGDWVRVNLLLWQLTGKGRYLDMAEHALRNHMLATQFSNGGFGHHEFLAMKDSGKSWPAAALGDFGAEAYWCCTMHGTQMAAEAARWGVLVQDDAILVTWIAEAKAMMRIGGKTVVVTTSQASPGTWTVVIECPDTVEAAVRFRVPGWAGAITVDGQSMAGKDGWAEIKRTWKDAVRVSVTLPEKIRLAGAYGTEVKEGEPVRIFSGADLYCLPLVDLPEQEAVPTLIMSTGKEPAQGVIPAIWVSGSGDRRRLVQLMPISNRGPGGCCVLFRVRDEKATEFDAIATTMTAVSRKGLPIEITIGIRGVGEAYLNGSPLMNIGGWVEAPMKTTMAKVGGNVLAIKARSEDVHPGMSAMIRIQDRLLVTQAGQWSVVACEESVPAAWLTNLKEGQSGAVPSADVGGYGDAPWFCHSAAFAGSGARWIWPSKPGERAKKWWLFRYEFKVDGGTR